jgi:DNA-binding MarR family transcriptional regulator
VTSHDHARSPKRSGIGARPQRSKKPGARNPADTLTDSDYAALAELRYEIRRFLNFSEATARGASVEPQQHQLLLAIRALPSTEPPTIGALAERLQIRHHSAVELASRSVKSGLVERHQGERDRREVTLRITAHGARILTELSLAHRNELTSAAPALLRALAAIVVSARMAHET